MLTPIRNLIGALCAAAIVLIQLSDPAPSLAQETAPAGTTWEPPYVGSDPKVLYLPDANAVYWRYGWKRKAGDTGGVVVRGTFPMARYFSYNVYDDNTKQTLGSFTDRELKAEAGAPNPFAGQERTPDARYEIYIVPEGSKVAGANVLTFPDSVENVSFMLRHYLAEGGIEGRVPMPVIASYDAATGKTQAAPPSAKVAKLSREEFQKYLMPAFKDVLRQLKENPAAVMAKLHEESGGDHMKMPELICRRVASGAFEKFHPGTVIESFRLGTEGTYPNKDNLYLVLPVVRTDDSVLIVRFKAPEFPATPADYPDSDLRYFSLSQGDETTRNFATATDKEMKVAPDGFIYFVIGDEDPALVKRAQDAGANFMPWKVKEKMMLVYRHMLPADGFKNGINSVPFYDGSKPEKGQEGSQFIGDYAPRGKLIPKAAALSDAGILKF